MGKMLFGGNYCRIYDNLEVPNNFPFFDKARGREFFGGSRHFPPKPT